MDQPSREAMAGKLQIYADRGRGAMTLPRPRDKVNGSHDMCKPSSSLGKALHLSAFICGSFVFALWPL